MTPTTTGRCGRGLASRILVVSGFLKTLTEVIEFGASAEADSVLAAMRRMPQLLRSRRKPTGDDVDETLVQGSWKRLVFAPADGAIDRNAYVFCVLTQFHRHLRRVVGPMARPTSPTARPRGLG